ncbi:MAG: pilus assembly protein [Ardenticatenia bacterium]|nr:MAG: pilus assembly protein [Ardenticatenia bacterium]
MHVCKDCTECLLHLPVFPVRMFKENNVVWGIMRQVKSQVKQYMRRYERGQSLVETSLTLIFLLVMLLAAFEMARVFTTYLTLVSSTRHGALYLVDKQSMLNEVGRSHCQDPELNQSETPTLYEFCRRIIESAQTKGLDPARLVISDPVYTDIGNGRYEIFVSVTYALDDLFTSTMSFPIIGRMGLPSSYQIRYNMTVETVW